MIRRQPRPKRTETRLPYTTRFRSVGTARKGRSIWVMTSRYRRGGARPPVLEAPARPGHLIGVRDTFRNGRDERIPHGGSAVGAGRAVRSEEHTSELQSLMRISYAVFCLKKKNYNNSDQSSHH